MRNRKVPIQFYLYEDEAKELKEWAKASKRSMSQYLRELIQGFQPVAFPPAEYSQVIWELQKIGVNMNQIASKAHTLGFVDEREYRAESERLWRVVAELTKPMARGGVKFGNHKDMGC